MKILDAGHRYELFVLDNEKEEPTRVELRFVKREGGGYPGNEGHYAGTNIQDVLRCLIDRCKYLNGQIQCLETEMAIIWMREAIWELEDRAARRHHRKRPTRIGTNLQIEEMAFCSKCGHVGCGGECHP
jgi:hypothetical protein